MKLKISFLICFSVLFGFSCVEDYNSLPSINSVTLVVNGCITNEEGPYRIQLLEDVAKGYFVESSPVLDAHLSITDHLGNSDVLKPLWEEQIVITDGGHRSCLLMPKYDGSYDSLSLEFSGSKIYYGVYYTTSIIGRQGGTYTLNISYKNQSYTATDKMPFGSEIDSVVLRMDGIRIDGKEKGTFDVPYMYFKKPEHESYFLLTHKKDIWYPQSPIPLPQPQKFDDILLKSRQTGITWNYDMISDRFMSSYISGFKLTGATSSPLISGTDEGFLNLHDNWTYADFYLVSVSREACFYYQALSDQFYQDGGSFSPAPSTPPSNLSNGAQGFFMAAAVDQKRVIREHLFR